MNQYYLQIDGIEDPKIFIEKWSEVYKYKLEYKYNDNIGRGFETDDTLTELMRWKNGTGENFSKNKTKPVEDFKSKREILSNLKRDFSFSEFETHFQPEKSSSIWKIFLLHVINPNNHPIFDQHVYRSFNFFRNGRIEELSTTKHNEVYRIYKEEYLPWFNQLKMKYELEPRKIDKGLFSFGRVLKTLNGLPVTILK